VTAITVPARIGLVVAGYVLAFMIAFAVVGLYAASRAAACEGSDGMCAFGESLVFLAVLGIAAVPATGGALFFLRPYGPIWPALSIGALSVAGTALAACVLFVAARGAEMGSALQVWSAFAILRILVTPLFALAFLLSALFAPQTRSRIALFAASGVEVAAFVCVALVWFFATRFH
jgi:hypothetical protein